MTLFFRITFGLHAADLEYQIHNSSLNEREVRKLFQQAEQIQLTTRSGNPLTRRYVFFSRGGFTEPAQALAHSEGAILVDLAYLDEVLADALR